MFICNTDNPDTQCEVWEIKVGTYPDGIVVGFVKDGDKYPSVSFVPAKEFWTSKSEGSILLENFCPKELALDPTFDKDQLYNVVLSANASFCIGECYSGGKKLYLELQPVTTASASTSAASSSKSPKKRTRQTLAGIESAQTLALPAAEVRPGLREIELTVWEGKLKSDLLENDPRWEVWNAKPASFVFAEDGHAPLGDLKRRAAEEWAALVAATPAGSTSLVVAHGAFNRVLLLTALGLPVDDFGFKDGHFAFENCALVELRWEPGDTHAAAWRKRYPTESEWRSREVEATRRAEVEGGEPPDVEAAEHGARVQGQQHQKGKEEL